MRSPERGSGLAVHGTDIAADATYREGMTTSADPRVIAFAYLVDRALRDARSRGLSIDDIEAETGVPKSTIYRWKRAEIANPQRALVLKFCERLNIPVVKASAALGWDGSKRPPAPEPFVDPDVQAVLRRLNGPDASEVEKVTIRATLRYLGQGGVAGVTLGGRERPSH